MMRSMLSSNPRFTDAWAKLGSVYEEMGQDEESLRAYAEGVKSSPASAAEFALSMTGLYLKQNRLDEARKHAAREHRVGDADDAGEQEGGRHVEEARAELGRHEDRDRHLERGDRDDRDDVECPAHRGSTLVVTTPATGVQFRP